jgi:hypothetical protein
VLFVWNMHNSQTWSLKLFAPLNSKLQLVGTIRWIALCETTNNIEQSPWH